MASSTKSVGRIDFVLRILVATGLAVELNRLLPLRELVNPYYFLTRSDSFNHIAGYPLIAILALSTIVGRLRDARMSPLYLFPISLLWIFSTVAFMFKTNYWPVGLALFVFMLIAGGFLPIRPAPVLIGFGDKSTGGVGESTLSETNAPEDEAEKDSGEEVERARTNLATPKSYLVALSVIACLWLALIYIDDVSGHGIGVWVARLGYAFLGFMWFGAAANRFKDAGLFDGRFFLYLIVVCTASLLPLINSLTTGYESLAIFVLIQIPTVFLKSKPTPEETLPESGRRRSSQISESHEREVTHAPSEIGEAPPQQKAPIFTGISSGRDKRASKWKPY